MDQLADPYLVIGVITAYSMYNLVSGVFEW